MAPTIGRHWRGDSQDYAALCDYCDVRYRRSQLKKQSSGRLACIGPGTNGCGEGRDEVELDKQNADIMRNRRRPRAHDGGRFDRLRSSVQDIFATSLMECWDTESGVLSTSSGLLDSWTGQVQGAELRRNFGGLSYVRAEHPDFYGRPAVRVMGGMLSTNVFALMPAGGRPFLAMAAQYIRDDNGGAVKALTAGTFKLSLVYENFARRWSAAYRSALDPAGTIARIDALGVGNVHHSRLYELDATGLFTLRAGAAEMPSAVSSVTEAPWDQITIEAGLELALLVVANAPTAVQIEEFRALGRSYAGRYP
jgi:hypothetical protein